MVTTITAVTSSKFKNNDNNNMTNTARVVTVELILITYHLSPLDMLRRSGRVSLSQRPGGGIHALAAFFFLRSGGVFFVPALDAVNLTRFFLAAICVVFDGSYAEGRAPVQTDRCVTLHLAQCMCKVLDTSAHVKPTTK